MKEELYQDIQKILGDVKGRQKEIIEKYLFELSAVYRIGREATTCVDLNKCLEMLASRISDLMSVEIVSIMLKEDETNILRIKFAKGIDEKIISDTIVKEEDEANNITGWVAKTGKPLLIEDLARDGRFPLRSGRYFNNSLLSVPLKIKDRTIGVINVNNKSSKDIFTIDDLGLLNKLADFAAAAIETVRQQQKDRILEQIKAELVSHISHEFRVPLTVIDEVIELLLREISSPLDDKQKRFLELAKQSTERLKRMIDEWLSYAKNGSREIKDNSKFFDLVSVTKHVVYSMDLLARNKGVFIKGRFPPESELKIWGNEDEITQVLVNLIHNAVKYNRDGGTAEVCFETLANIVKIYISDTGIGIPEQSLEKIFDKYGRHEAVIEQNLEGHGLGLSISREIVRKHGGEISVTSQVGKGSTFVVTLPINPK